MLISSIVLVVLRLFCVALLIQSFIQMAVRYEILFDPDFPLISKILIPLVALLIPVIIWLAAPTLSRLVIGKRDAAVPISGLSLGDLYAFAFVFLGLYFALSSVADTLNWFHYFLRVNSGTPLLPSEQMPSYYSLSRPLITMIAGLVCLFPGRRWARKLAASDQPSNPSAG